MVTETENDELFATSDATLYVAIIIVFCASFIEILLEAFIVFILIPNGKKQVLSLSSMIVRLRIYIYSLCTIQRLLCLCLRLRLSQYLIPILLQIDKDKTMKDVLRITNNESNVASRPVTSRRRTNVVSCRVGT